MSAIPGDDSFDPEEGAERAANAVYLRYMIRKGAAMGAYLATIAVFTLADFAAAILAAWRVPQWAIGFLISFVVADAVSMAAGMWRGFRARKAQPRTDAVTPSWRENVRKPKWLLGLGITLIYMACAALVLTGWLGLTTGLAVWALYVLLRIAFRWSAVKRLLPSLRGVLAFTDMDTPRDSPEI